MHSFLDGATTVNVNLYVRSFEKIDDVKMVSKNTFLEKRTSCHTLDICILWCCHALYQNEFVHQRRSCSC